MANLTPEQLAELRRLFSTPQGSGDGNAYMPNTVDYGGQTYKQDNAGGFVGTGPLYGDKQYHFNNYDTSGAQTAEGEAQMSKWSPEMDFLKAMGALVGGGLAMGGPAGFGFGGAGGPGSAGWGMSLDSATGGSGALEAMGGGSMGGSGAMGGGTAAMGGGTNVMGAGAGAGVDSSLLNGLNGSDIMSDAFVSNGGYGGGGFGGTSGGWWDNLINGRGGNGLSGLFGNGASGATNAAGAAAGGAKNPILGLGMSLLGGALGSQGIDKTATEQKEPAAWLKPYAEKVLGYGGSLLDQQMSPEYQQGWANLRNQGLGLLSQPIAGNGFSKFFPGK